MYIPVITKPKNSKFNSNVFPYKNTNVFMYKLINNYEKSNKNMYVARNV